MSEDIKDRLVPVEGMTKEGTERIIEETLAAYNDKARKRRAPHMGVGEPEKETCAVKSNKKIVPGVMSARGCAYAGAKGVVWGPIRDMVHVSHGPIGCGYYSWGTRRNLVQGTIGVDSFSPIDFTSDFQERDIVYGGDKKLEKLIREADELFPLNKGVSVLSECPVGLIGDDINAVCKKMEGELGKFVIPCNCEGFRGVSQSLGHHISNDSLRDHAIGKRTFGEAAGPYDIALIGEYNIGGDAWSSKPLLEECGFNVKSVWTGDGEIEKIAATHEVKLVAIHCYRSMNYMCRVLEERWGIPWIEFNFFGPSKIAASLRKLASYFDDHIKENVEKVIAKYTPVMQGVIDEYRPRLESKKVMLLIGGLRPRHAVGAYEDLGMEVVGTGYEFAHQDDYDRTQRDMKVNTLIFDDPAEWELEKWAKDLGVDLIGSGIKEKYVFQKEGLPFRQMHSWDYSGPYHGYEGFKVFARDMDMAVNSPTWKLVKSPF